MANHDSHFLPFSLEVYSLIWLDSQDSLIENSQEIQQRARSSINNLQTFKNADECVESILLSTTDQIIFVVNAGFGQFIIPLIHEISHIIAIYVYDVHEYLQMQSLNGYSKVKLNRIEIGR